MNFCPRCHLVLTTAECGGMSLFGCTECGGCWFPSGSLSELCGSNRPELAELHRNSLWTSRTESYVGLVAYCPKCRTSVLAKTAISPEVEITSLFCTQCNGEWLDAEEIKALAGLSDEHIKESTISTPAIVVVTPTPTSPVIAPVDPSVVSPSGE